MGCYICGKSGGHETGCPFKKQEQNEYICIECGESTCFEDAVRLYDDGMCLCYKCSEEFNDKQKRGKRKWQKN